MADDLREVARRRNERNGLGPITGPAVLRKVADLMVACRSGRPRERSYKMLACSGDRHGRCPAAHWVAWPGCCHPEGRAFVIGCSPRTQGPTDAVDLGTVGCRGKGAGEQAWRAAGSTAAGDLPGNICLVGKWQRHPPIGLSHQIDG